MDNMYSMSIKMLFAYVFKRLILLFAKLLSFKCIVWLMGTYLLFVGKLNATTWVTLSIAIVCGRLVTFQGEGSVQDVFNQKTFREKKDDVYDSFKKDKDDAFAPPCSPIVHEEHPSLRGEASTRSVIANGQRKIRDLLRGKGSAI